MAVRCGHHHSPSAPVRGRSQFSSGENYDASSLVPLSLQQRVGQLQLPAQVRVLRAQGRQLVPGEDRQVVRLLGPAPGSQQLRDRVKVLLLEVVADAGARLHAAHELALAGHEGAGGGERARALVGLALDPAQRALAVVAAAAAVPERREGEVS